MKNFLVLILTIPFLTACGSLLKTIGMIEKAQTILGMAPLIFSLVMLVTSGIICYRTRTTAAQVFYIVCLAGSIAQWFDLFGHASIINPRPLLAALAIHSFGIICYALLLPKFGKVTSQVTLSE